jgi:arsenate reductase
MLKIHHLSTCDTCQRIIKELELNEKGFDFQDIKLENISEEELDIAKEKFGSYEALFSKRAQKFRKMGLNDVQLTETDFRKYILEEYTFLKRPFIWIGDEVFVGNAKKTVEAAKAALDE